ncbi:MAG: hypothetical protein KAI24_20885 [Planctomycetes bacterium]|nr:hypothetical protein [Planctomycetota bacterium]
MRKILLLATITVAVFATDVLEAQRGGGRSRNRWRRPEEVQNRVAVYFQEVAGPATDGDKVADLNTIELVRAAAAADQVTLLYLHDGEADERAVRLFEAMLFRADKAGDELGIKLRLFHCGQIDISKSPALQERYGKTAPLFVAFDKAGKELRPVSMRGLKPDARGLEGLLDRAAKGAFKPTLPAFAKKYGKLVAELEKVLNDKAEAEQDQAKAGDDKGKQNQARRELEAAAKAEQKLLDEEQKLLADVRIPARGNKKLGGLPNRRGDRGGNTGKGNTGKGNTGRGNTGRGNTGRGRSDG